MHRYWCLSNIYWTNCPTTHPREFHTPRLRASRWTSRLPSGGLTQIWLGAACDMARTGSSLAYQWNYRTLLAISHADSSTEYWRRPYALERWAGILKHISWSYFGRHRNTQTFNLHMASTSKVDRIFHQLHLIYVSVAFLLFCYLEYICLLKCVTLWCWCLYSMVLFSLCNTSFICSFVSKTLLLSKKYNE